ENSRYNPIPFYIRAVGVDRFARKLQGVVTFRYRIFGIPHYGHTPNFAAFTSKEIAEQSERAVVLTAANTVVMCSTQELVSLYQQLGFSIAPAELLEEPDNQMLPIELVREIGNCGAGWVSNEKIQSNLSEAT